MERIAVIMGKMHSGGKKNLVMEYYRHIDRSKIQFDFICDEDSNAIPTDEIEKLGGRVYIVPRYQNILANIKAIEKICKENKYKIAHGYNGTMNIFGLYAAWRAGVSVRINESISMAHKSDKKTIIKNILKPFSRCFATHFMANGEACGKWQFGKLYDEGKVAVFKTVINTAENQFQPELRDKVNALLKVQSTVGKDKTHYFFNDNEYKGKNAILTGVLTYVITNKLSPDKINTDWEKFLGDQKGKLHDITGTKGYEWTINRHLNEFTDKEIDKELKTLKNKGTKLLLSDVGFQKLLNDKPEKKNVYRHDYSLITVGEDHYFYYNQWGWKNIDYFLKFFRVCYKDKHYPEIKLM